MDNAPTIRTLAQTAGVSKTTVSLALRDHPRIRLEVRQRIQRMAAEAGYRPNALVANLLAQLRSSKTSTYQSTVGLLCMFRDRSILQLSPTFCSWVAGCRARATEQGYGFDQFWAYEPGISPARLLQILETRNIRGLAIVGLGEQAAVARKFGPIWRHAAPVALGLRPTVPAIHFVSNDQYVTVTEAVRQVVRLGYRRPGLCMASHVDDSVENKFSAGFYAAHQRLLTEPRLPVFDVQLGVKKRFAHWLELHRPDVILTIHSEIREWVASLGLSVPEDVGLVHLDKSSTSESWAGMRQNSELIGRSAMDMIIGQLHRNESGVPAFQKCMLINSTWEPAPTVRGKKSPGGESIPAPSDRPRRGSRAVLDEASSAGG